ncbi:MAG: type II CRISPR RNA-guided endonuclease Cas9 [Ignavibacteria bacterium]
MTKILGLDIGTNSIGGCLINLEEFGEKGNIEWMGSRIIPVDGDYLQKFESGGQTETKAAARRQKRGSRRLKQRYVLRRTRLIKALKILGWLNKEYPDNFKEALKENKDFKFNINNFIPIDKNTIEEAAKVLGVKNKDGKLSVSIDWVVYYLRKKALKEKISMNELVRIIYMMNQRRGFRSSRKDKKEDEEKKTEKWVEILKVDSIEEKQQEVSEKNFKKQFSKIYIIKAGKHTWEEKRINKPEWLGKELNFLITKETLKSGEEKFKFQQPKQDDWEMSKVALEQDIKNSGLNVGEYFFNHLVNDKNYRIRQQIIDRCLYQKEFEEIWNKQCEYYPGLKDTSKLKEISLELYKHNEAKQKEIQTHDIYYLITKDIIYYQRELRSQKHSISLCKYEKGKFKKDNVEIYKGYKVAPKSSPEFQEFRIWQDIHNIRILERDKIINGKIHIDYEVTKDFINNDIKEKLFDLFDKSAEVSETAILRTIDKKLLSTKTHKVNLFASKDKLKGNETNAYFRKVFNKFGYDGDELLNDEKRFYRLWHIMYSISSSNIEISKKGIETALRNANNGFNLSEEIIKELANQPEFKEKQYAAYSSKAINKLLQVMRCGKYWKSELINDKTTNRIAKIITGEYDENIDDRTREQIARNDLNVIEDFQGLETSLSCYVVYGIHSERQNDEKYTDYKDIDVMKLIPNNSLRNPIVEQIIRETLFVVKDLWKKYGRPDEIHIELGRELKKNEEERKKLAETGSKNFRDKERIKNLLIELINDGFPFETKPNPNSPIDVDKFRIYESSSGSNYFEYEKKMKVENSNWKPTSPEIKKYALWLEQKCCSPYTGKAISITRLFTNEYELEHIIPRAKLKYDSMENLVICESDINKEKGNKLAANFISESPKTINRNGKEFTILNYDEYVALCKSNFRGRKLKNLLCDEVPNDFISRQLNDTRYITRKVSELLYPIVKDKAGIIYTGGSITAELKREWGLTKVWKDLMKPRFERLEEITGKQLIIKDANDRNNYHLETPEPETDIKRIDHRHHALDALIIAATTREHIRYLNSLSSVDSESELKDIKRKLVKGKIREFKLPWDGFHKETKDKLNEIIVSFKSNNKVISKPKNKYLHWECKEGKWVKELKPQKANKKWLSVRKSMFKEPQGIIWLKEIEEKKIIDAVNIHIERQKSVNDETGKPRAYIYDKIIREQVKMLLSNLNNDTGAIKKYLSKNPLLDVNGDKIDKVKIAVFNEYASKKVTVDSSFTYDKINNIPYAEKIIEKFEKLESTDSFKDKRNLPLPYLLKKHLDEYDGNSKEAFEGEGLENLFKKAGRPIKKVTRYEKKKEDDKFKGKYVETDKGGIVYFVMYENSEGIRSEMFSVSVHQAIEKIIQGKEITEEKEGYKKIVLSPNDLVYMPTEEELEKKAIDWNNKVNIFKRTYKMVSSTGKQCFFVPHFVSKSLDTNGKELGANNKAEKPWYILEPNEEFKAWDDNLIKKSCIKMNIDKLGNINPFYSYD